MIGFAEYIKSCEDYLYFLNEIIFNELIHIDFSYKKIVNPFSTKDCRFKKYSSNWNGIYHVEVKIRITSVFRTNFNKFYNINKKYLLRASY